MPVRRFHATIKSTETYVKAAWKRGGLFKWLLAGDGEFYERVVQCHIQDESVFRVKEKAVKNRKEISLSAYHITNYPQLMNVLKEDEKIVYLCGAGASMSLGDHGMNWPAWILFGKKYLLPDEQSELDRRIGRWTTDELISAATYLLDKLKAAAKYQLFMDNTIGSLHPNNKEFETALCRIWRAGDFIATTNYDLQIEEAVSAESVSYSSAGNILPIIQGKAENKIIHLHGMYDKLHGIDDIIADDPQYNGILADAGAQFIQNLISTHPIMIIGCGGTVEDPNLAGFMSFVADKLGINNIPYFYVMKEGDAIPSLPPNAIPVYYGTEYEDLAFFLSELALFRLKRRIRLKTVISVNPYKELGNAVSAFGRMHFSNGFNEFVGRNEEFEKLNLFLDDPADHLWWGITGAGGIGKSRLILEWLRQMPAKWFGFFARKTKEAESFIPFTDTVIVFDYILGEERQCVEAIEALLDVFDNTAYKLRMIFIERDQKNTEDSWLVTIKHSLSAEIRLCFEAAHYNMEFMEICGLSEEEEKKYIQNYLQVYLPLLPADDFTEYCRNNVDETSCKIQEAFRAVVDPSCYRPLYLSIFTEVWIAKRGELSFNGVEELLNEYLTKEKKRWTMILGDEILVHSYMHLLAVACVISRFNITDVMGENYLADDCGKLSDFFDRKDRIPGTDNVCTDLFVTTDELEETDEESSVFLHISKEIEEGAELDDGVSENDDHEGIKALSMMEKDERFAFSTPYIKLEADPEEVFLHMLNNKGLLTEEESLRLQSLREMRIQKYADMPDYAWVIEPVFPDIISAYIVAYVVKERDAVKFTQLTRSNSVLEIQRFLARALEDWPSKELFEKMAVTPPREVLNYFEYYVGLLGSISYIHDFKPVEKALYDTDASVCFQRYEMELWRRMAVVLTDRGDVERLYESGLNFIAYIENLAQNIEVFDTVSEVLEAYIVGLHNAEEVLKLSSYLEKCNGIARLLPEKRKIGYLCCENYGRLFHLRLYHGEKAEEAGDWQIVSELIEQYDYPKDMCKMLMPFAGEYLRQLVRKKKIDKIRQLQDFLEVIYEKNPILEVAETLALATVNRYRMSSKREKVKYTKGYENLKRYFMDFPDSMKVRSAYISASDEEYKKYGGGRDVPVKIMTWAKDWSEQYPDEIEFQEGYFGLLLTHLNYVRFQRKKNEERRTFKRMKELAEKTDYSAYKEDNRMSKNIVILQKLYGYK